VRSAALALAALALAGCLAGCESSQEKNAELEKVAKREAAKDGRTGKLTQHGLSITHPSRTVKVGQATVLHGSEQTSAAVVTVTNTSAITLRDVPIEVTVKDAHGATVYTNTTPGLTAALVSLPLLPAHSTRTWVDDQVQTSSTPTSVSAEVGEGEHDSEAPPELIVVGVHTSEGGIEGGLANHSHSSQSEVVLYAIARRAGKIVAAGSSVVSQAEAGATAHFQTFLAGSAKGAQLEVSVGGAA
jgi:hypothetical protein